MKNINNVFFHVTEASNGIGVGTLLGQISA